MVMPLLALTACGGMSYAIENYKGVDIERFDYAGQTFRIFDKPEESRLMITPSIGKAALGGATFGAANTAEMTYTNAAQEYLNSTGRKCIVSDLKLVVKPQWETFYNCS